MPVELEDGNTKETDELNVGSTKVVELDSGYPTEDLKVGVVSSEVEQGVDETSPAEEDELGVRVGRGVEETGYGVGLSSEEVVHGVLVASEPDEEDEITSPVEEGLLDAAVELLITWSAEEDDDDEERTSVLCGTLEVGSTEVG